MDGIDGNITFDANDSIRESKTYRFEKKLVNRDVDCWCSGWFFWPKIGVDGAEPRLHAFSYDVSGRETKQNKQFQLNLMFIFLASVYK